MGAQTFFKLKEKATVGGKEGLVVTTVGSPSATECFIPNSRTIGETVWKRVVRPTGPTHGENGEQLRPYDDLVQYITKAT